MKTKKVVFYLLAIVLGGCVLPSIHQLYTEQELIFEEKLIGKWADNDNNIWEFREDGEQAYEMRIFDGKEGRFKAHLVKLEDMMFLDIFPDIETLGDIQDFYNFHLLPAHTFMKVDQIDPNLQLRMMNPEEVSEMLEEDPNLLKHEVPDDGGIILTASTKQLQEFMIQYVNVEDVFDDPMEFTRLEPLYADEDIVFDEKLIGEWEGKDGEILDSIRLNENAYDMIFIDKEGKEYQFFANLVKLEGLTFLAVFADRTSVEEKSPYGFHLIPDFFGLVKQIEPELQVQKMDYEEVLELLRNGPPSLKQEAAEADQVFKRIW